MEHRFVDVYAKTADAAYAATKAGYSHAATNGAGIAAKESIKSAVAALREKMITVAAPKAVDRLVETLKDAPIGATLNKAIDITLRFTLGADADVTDKDPHEMTMPELHAYMRQTAERSRLLDAVVALPPLEIDPTTGDPAPAEAEAEPDIFA